VPEILIVDDHPLTRRGIAVTIESEPNLVVAGEAEDGKTAVDWLASHEPDLVTVDLSLPDMSGFELVRQIAEAHPNVRVLVISHFENATCAGRALREGARGFVGKSESTEVLITALTRILDGGIYVSRPIQDRLLRDLMTQKEDGRSPLEVLSTRELDVFEMTGEGLGTREIAERLNLSVKTVESYRRRVRAKLKLPSNPRLMQEAVRWIETRSKC
jgi:DNA-binding NarL/FixJ family response regulator